MRNIFLFLLVIVHLNLNAQKCNNNWCFGDSAGINFDNTINPQTFNCAAKSRGSCCSVSDSLGNLLFYAFTRAAMALKSTRIFNAQNNIMVNGDTIVGEGWYQELVIVPNPIDKNQYYLFSISVTGTSGYGLYYSTIDMSLNNGLGEVTQKNVQLNSLVATDCLNAVKHGNGKDWWIIFRSAKDTQNPNNKFWVYLIDSNGISTPSVQQQGINLNYHSLGNLEFSKSGDKFCHVMAGDRIETYNFDRCTGIITVDKTIDTLNFQNLQYQYYISVQFSPSGRYLYVGQIDTTSYLLQFDLQATNIKASRVIIDSFPFPDYCVGKVKLAPDGKIYLSNWYNDGLNFPYPYPDTTYNIYNTYLSVINDPDSAGLGCNFTPYSFYLGGNRTYWGLPNNPDYDLPGDSACIYANLTPGPSPHGEGRIQCTYISAWEKLFVNASGLMGKNVTVSVYDGRGSLKIEFSSLKNNAGYFTLDVDCGGWSDGLYIVNLKTEKEMLGTKFIKN